MVKKKNDHSKNFTLCKIHLLINIWANDLVDWSVIGLLKTNIFWVEFWDKLYLLVYIDSFERVLSSSPFLSQRSINTLVKLI